MTVETTIVRAIDARLSEAWPGAVQTRPPTRLAGGFWATMFRLSLGGQPAGVPGDVVFRIAPDAAMGAKELAVQRSVAELGYPTPPVRLAGPAADELGGAWSVMDYAAGVSPLGDLNGLAALRRAPKLFRLLPVQLADAMAALHALDPARVTEAVKEAAPSVAWRVEDLLGHFEAGAAALGRPDLAAAVGASRASRPSEGRVVVCHGDLHPFNLLVGDEGVVTVIDWTAAICAEPAFDIAYTSILVGNPPLDAPGPLGWVIGAVGRRLARRFVTHYLKIAGCRDIGDIGDIEWYRALHGTRILIELAHKQAHSPQEAARHPYRSLVPAATAAIASVVGRIPAR